MRMNLLSIHLNKNTRKKVDSILCHFNFSEPLNVPHGLFKKSGSCDANEGNYLGLFLDPEFFYNIFSGVSRFHAYYRSLKLVKFRSDFPCLDPD